MEYLSFPFWLRATHAVNFLLMFFLIGSGVRLLALHPALYKNDSCAPGSQWLQFSWLQKIAGEAISEESLHKARSIHYFCASLWCLNGIVYVALLIITGEWHRIVPIDTSVLANAITDLQHYLSGSFPVAQRLTHYGALQQLCYFMVVFVMAPLTVLTGWAVSPLVAEHYPSVSKLFFGRQNARSVHVLLALGFLAFIAAHIIMVAITGVQVNLNRIFFGIEMSGYKGLFAFAFSIGILILSKRLVNVIKVPGPKTNLEANPDCNVSHDPTVDLKAQIKKLLCEEGLQTQMEPFPETDKEFDAIVSELGKLPGSELRQKLIIAGFHDKPVFGRKCFECIYYKVHSGYCELPELQVPVEPDWWCRLWRV